MHNGPGLLRAQVVETVHPAHSVFSYSYFAGVRFPAPPSKTGNGTRALRHVSRFSFLGFWLSACGPQATAARLWKGRRAVARWGTRQPRMAEGLGERAGAKTRIACALHAQIAARSRERRLERATGRRPAAAWEPRGGRS